MFMTMKKNTPTLQEGIKGFEMLNKIIPMSQVCKSMKNNRQLQWYYNKKKYSSLNK